MDEPPGCIVLLLRLSAGMTADVVTPRGEMPAFVAARGLADELLEGLVNTAAAGFAVGALDLAVLGYRTSEDGNPQLISLLPDGDHKPRFVPLAQICDMPAVPRDGEGQPRKWAVLPACAGEPCASSALASVYQMVAVWLTGRYASRPPVVIHCTGADGFDEAYFRAARSLNLLATAHGPVRLLHYVFAEPTPPGPPSLKGRGEKSLPSPLAGEGGGAWPPGEGALSDTGPRSSSELGRVPLTRLEDSPPSPARGEGKDFSPLPFMEGVGRVFRNEWDIGDPWDAIFTFAPEDESVAWADAGAGFTPACAMWAQKMGNTPEQWEDAYALDAANGAVAIADGASTGIYCSIWAQQLSQRFLSDRPDTRDPLALNKWVNGLRTEWRTAINYSNLNWSKQAKVDQTGAAATLLGLEVGPAGADGNRPWRACAVGDASLFWVRGGKLLATFPVVAADQFGSAPLLVRSNPGFRTVALAAAGACEPGDRFVLATDAVAARLFKSVQHGDGVDWARFEALPEDEWRAELDVLRRGNDMVNDDCTLVVLRVNKEVALAMSEEVREGPHADAVANEEVPGAVVASEDVANELLAEEVIVNEADTALPSPTEAQAQTDFIAAGAGDLMIELPPPAPEPEDGTEPTDPARDS